MLDTQIAQTTNQLTAVIRLTIPRRDPNVMGPGLAELPPWPLRLGPGRAMVHTPEDGPAIFDFEICVPVAAPVALRAKAGHFARYDSGAHGLSRAIRGLGGAWGEFDAWIAANGHTPGPDLWECYVVGPETSPDPANWRTQLNRPLSA